MTTDIDDIEDCPEYLHGCVHGYTSADGCPHRCSRFDQVLVEVVPGRGYVPILVTPKEPHYDDD